MARSRAARFLHHRSPKGDCMAGSTISSELLTELHNRATQLRIDSVRATSEAGSGHPSSCCSAAEIVAALFFSVMRYDPKNPKAPNSDRFILSKGHAERTNRSLLGA